MMRMSHKMMPTIASQPRPKKLSVKVLFINFKWVLYKSELYLVTTFTDPHEKVVRFDVPMDEILVMEIF